MSQKEKDKYRILMEKEMATHSSILAERIPGMGEPGGLTSMGSHRVGHDWSDLAAAAVPIKPTTTTEGWRKGKNSKRIYRTSQNIRIINVFLESLLSRVLSLAGSHSPPHLPRMPSNTADLGPALGAAQILIWSYSCVFLPAMSTAIRTSAFSFVGALNDLLYILQT